MNEAGREELVKASLSGVRQIKGALFDWPDVGRCALGVLISAAYHMNGMTATAAFGLSDDWATCPVCERVLCSETRLITHLNDDHEFSFLDIARKLPDSETLTVEGKGNTNG